MNNYFIGNKGRVWINDVLYADCYKAEMKRQNTYEEIPDQNGNGMIQVPVGYSISGSISIRKKGNESILQELKKDKNNSLDISVIIKEEHPVTGKTERIKYIGVTVDEFPLSQFENRKITEIELPLKAVDYEVLQ